MIRLFRHYVSRALLTALVAEALHLFLSIYLGRSLRVVLLEHGSWPPLIETLPSALAFTMVMISIMVALGLYERNLWDGKGDMLLRVGVSFLLGSFVMTLVYYLLPDLYLGRSEFSLALGIGLAAMKSRLHRARLRLAAQLRRDGPC